MNALEEAARSEGLTLMLALLNVLQTLWLAEIASRSRRIRRTDRRRTAEKPAEEERD